MWKVAAPMIAGAPLVGLGVKLLALYDLPSLGFLGIAKLLGFLLAGLALWGVSAWQHLKKG